MKNTATITHQTLLARRTGRFTRTGGFFVLNGRTTHKCVGFLAQNEKRANQTNTPQ